jgi:hypothetical protein
MVTRARTSRRNPDKYREIPLCKITFTKKYAAPPMKEKPTR